MVVHFPVAEDALFPETKVTDAGQPSYRALRFVRASIQSWPV